MAKITTRDISKLSQIMHNNFEISLMVFMPNITTNHAITYTNVRGTQREYSSKPHKHSIDERTLVFKRQIKDYVYPLKIFHLFGFPS